MLCTVCGGPYGFCRCLGGPHGIGGTFTAAYGGADPSSGFGPGTAAQIAAGVARSQALSTQQVAAYQNALAGALGGLANQAFMGAYGLGLGQMAQPHPLQNLHSPPPPAKPLPVAGISVGEFIGWRVWRIMLEQNLLASYSANYVWLPEEPAEGQPGDHDGAGLWAFKEAHRSFEKVQELGYRGVIGSVRLWGQVIEHRNGYRGEFAEVRSLDFCLAGDEFLAKLRKRYGVGSDKDAEAAEADRLR